MTAMQTAVDARRIVIDTVLERIIHNGDGEVYAEDVNDVITGLGLMPTLFNKVAGTLEQIVGELIVARAFSSDPEWAWDMYHEGRYPGFNGVDYFAECHETEAERGIALLMGLAALSS